MLKERIKYTDFLGQEREEDFYFNLSKAELSIMNVSAEGEGGLQEQLRNMVLNREAAKIIEFFEGFVSRSFGIRTEDGRSFVKTATARDQFLGSPAYDQLFMRLVTDSEYAVTFLKGVLPGDMGEEFDAAVSAEEAKQRSSQEARARSEAAMQGHKRPAEREIQTVTEEEAPPVASAPIDFGPDETQASERVKLEPTLPENARSTFEEPTDETRETRGYESPEYRPQPFVPPGVDLNN